ncbi:zinc finger CCCH domain-containing protein 8-like [Denticeps clupeoides]|uniref:zinc finger CCCH domain-containing protein 8-like n=1 Tax=Denticeps clupeoides TaxID=299321 RepID=UPI0010A5A045|nr:zinc finger CCCH domain-containing protein 8 [Denticeps clupeoides]
MDFASLFAAPPGHDEGESAGQTSDPPALTMPSQPRKRALQEIPGVGKSQKRGRKLWGSYDSEASNYCMVPFNYEQKEQDFLEELNQYRQTKEAEMKSTKTICASNKLQFAAEEHMPHGRRKDKQNVQQKCGALSQNKGRATVPIKGGAHLMRGRGCTNRGGSWTNKNKSASANCSSGLMNRDDGSFKGGRRQPKPEGKLSKNALPKNQSSEPVQKGKPFMTQEFKELNSLEIGGRLICKHFLRGRCIKGDDCHFEHTFEGVKKNELCKFYVQGCCSKENCIYMHSTFPCKFFHLGRKCLLGESCKFSHEPLTELTRGLLEKVEEEMRKETMKLTNTEEPKIKEEQKPLEDIRLNFYNSIKEPEPVCQFGGTASCEGNSNMSDQPPTTGALNSVETTKLAPETPTSLTMSTSLYIRGSAMTNSSDNSESGSSVLRGLFLRLSPCSFEEDPDTANVC